jgi:hypothetical protein
LYAEPGYIKQHPNVLGLLPRIIFFAREQAQAIFKGLKLAWE